MSATAGPVRSFPCSCTVAARRMWSLRSFARPTHFSLAALSVQVDSFRIRTLSDTGGATPRLCPITDHTLLWQVGPQDWAGARRYCRLCLMSQRPSCS